MERKLIDQALIDKISEKIDDPLWLAGIEQQVVQHIQDRVTAKFANAASMPEILAAIKYNVSELFQQGYLPDLKDYVDTSLVKITIDRAIQSMVERTIDNLVIDPVWLSKIESVLKQQLIFRIQDNLNKLDFNDLVKEHLNQGINDWQETIRKDFINHGIPALTSKLTDVDLSEKISNKIEDPRWIESIEQQIVSHVQDRITAKFANASTMPEILETIKHNVAELFQRGYLPDLSTYIDPTMIRSTVDRSVELLINRALDNLIMDPIWLTKIETIIKQQMPTRILDNFSRLNFEKIVREQIDVNAQRWQQDLLENFNSRGIQDLATDTRLVITDDGVVVTDGLAAQELLVEKDLRVNGTIVVDKLAVLNGMNTDAPGWAPVIDDISNRTFDKIDQAWRTELTKQVLDLARTEGIEFRQILLNGSPIVDEDQLNPTIRVSNIQKLGILDELRVRGTVNLNDSVTVINHRLGINTEAPEMALSVWDEEVSLVAGKLSKDRAYIGSGRGQGLTIGINRIPQIEISADGLTTIKQLCVGRHRVSHADQVPGWNGTKGDIVFNSSPGPGSPFAWQCLGGFQWQPLHSK